MRNSKKLDRYTLFETSKDNPNDSKYIAEFADETAAKEYAEAYAVKHGALEVIVSKCKCKYSSYEILYHMYFYGSAHAND